MELFRAKDLIGKSLQPYDAPSFGSVTDIYFDAINKSVRYVVVETGAMLHRRYALLSPSNLDFPTFPDQDSVSVNLRKREIEEAPEADEHRPVSKHVHLERSHPIYDIPFFWGGSFAWQMTPLPQMVGDEIEDSSEAISLYIQNEEKRNDSQLHSFLEIQRYSVAALDSTFGILEDVLIDSKTLEIAYLMVDVMRWWPSKSVLIPEFALIGFAYPQRYFDVYLYRDQIKELEEFNVEDINTFDYAALDQRCKAFYEHNHIKIMREADLLGKGPRGHSPRV